MGDALVREERFRDAEEHLETAVAIRSDDALSHLSLAFTSLYMGRMQQALQITAKDRP